MPDQITAAPADERRVRNNITRLAIAQALAGANSSVIFATGAIIGAMLAPDPAYATVPLSVFVVGMAGGTLPAGWIARHHGRRAAFIVGTGIGVATGLLAALALWVGSFALFTCSTLCGGLYASVVQSFRFAAAEGASDRQRPKAVSYVMLGGIFAGVLGPQLVTWTMDALPPYTFVVSFLAQSLVALLAMAVLSGVKLPAPAKQSVQGRPLRAIVTQPRFVTAAICGVVSYLLMNFLMTSAPLAMHMCGLPISASNWAIQWHIVAMYAPSFLTGSVIARFGAARVVAVGMVLLVGSAATGLSGMAEGHFTVGLILLGIGWNFGFVGASNMVLETHRPEERHKVQAFNDFVVFGIIAVGSFASGELLVSHGWWLVNLVALPPIAIGLAALAVARGLVATARVAPHSAP